MGNLCKQYQGDVMSELHQDYHEWKNLAWSYIYLEAQAWSVPRKHGKSYLHWKSLICAME